MNNTGDGCEAQVGSQSVGKLLKRKQLSTVLCLNVQHVANMLDYSLFCPAVASV